MLGAFVAPSLPQSQCILFELWGALVLFYIPALLLFLTAIFATLRYRLWDIDLIIRRTVTYAVVAVLLALVYFGSVIVLQRLIALATGQRSELITALSIPLRNHIQNDIDKHYYSRKFDTRQVLAHFAAMVRDETDLERLSNELVNVVHATMEPRTVSLWLKPWQENRR